METALLTVTVDGPIITARGEIDLTTADSFRYGIECAIHESVGEVVADLRAVDFIDSAALMVLLGSYHALKAAGRGFCTVCAPHSQPQRVIVEISQFHTVWRHREINPGESLTADNSDCN